MNRLKIHFKPADNYWACAMAGAYKSALEKKGNPPFSLSMEVSPEVPAAGFLATQLGIKERDSLVVDTPTEDDLRGLDRFFGDYMAQEYKIVHGFDQDTSEAPVLPTHLAVQAMLLRDFGVHSKGGYWFPAEAKEVVRLLQGSLPEALEADGVCEDESQLDHVNAFLHGRGVESPVVLILGEEAKTAAGILALSGPKLKAIGLHPLSPLMPVLRGRYTGYRDVSNAAPILSVAPSEGVPASRHHIAFARQIRVMPWTPLQRLEDMGKAWNERQSVKHNLREYTKKNPRIVKWRD